MITIRTPTIANMIREDSQLLENFRHSAVPKTELRPSLQAPQRVPAELIGHPQINIRHVFPAIVFWAGCNKLNYLTTIVLRTAGHLEVGGSSYRVLSEVTS